ncbi:MAG: hypothetical protein ABSB71_11295 [Candidatus Bathyarchaeia archaeon]|jgi:Fe-S oxidoreductase
MPKDKSEKIVYVCSIACPGCKQNIDVLKKVRIIAPAEKAVKEELYYAAKSSQTLLPGA